MKKNSIVSFSNPKSIEAEAFRALRTNLEFSITKEEQKVILITSSNVSEGKSTVSANLGVVFAMQNKKTIIVDIDMRRGSQHKNFDVSNKCGLSNYLSGVNYDAKDFIKCTGVDNLFLITAGAVPPNPAELISLDTMDKLLAGLREEYDIIILDGAPVLPVTDSVILSTKVDKIILVVSAGETHKSELVAAKTTIENVGAKVSGVVLNKINIRDKFHMKYGNKYYGNYYAYDDNKSKEKKSKKK